MPQHTAYGSEMRKYVSSISYRCIVPPVFCTRKTSIRIDIAEAIYHQI
jgi:hypothetical protein